MKIVSIRQTKQVKCIKNQHGFQLIVRQICLEYFSIDAIIGYDFILLFYPVIAFFVLLMKAEILLVRKWYITAAA